MSVQKKFLLILFISFAFLGSLNAQWIPNACGLPYDSKFPCLIITNEYSYAATDFGVFSNDSENTHWSLISQGIPEIVMNCLLLKDTRLYAGTDAGYIYFTTNRGTKWFNVSNGLPSSSSVYSLISNGNILIAGMKNRQVYISQDSGSTWNNASNGLPSYINGKIVLAVNGSTIYAGTDGAGIYKTQNYGSNWQAINVGLLHQNVRSFCFSGSYIFVGTIGGGVYCSTNNGSLWMLKNSGLGNYNVNSLITIGSRIIAGTDNGIFITTNNGTNWFPRNKGWSSPKILSFSTGQYLNAGTESDMVWMRPLIEIVSVKNISSEIPEKYFLFQNYPNPFNPITKIRFDIKKKEDRSQKSEVRLIIYNILGKEIKTLVNEELNPGSYEVTFDGSNISSGIYYYKLSVNGFNEIKKMTLIK